MPPIAPSGRSDAISQAVPIARTANTPSPIHIARTSPSATRVPPRIAGIVNRGIANNTAFIITEAAVNPVATVATSSPACVSIRYCTSPPVAAPPGITLLAALLCSRLRRRDQEPPAAPQGDREYEPDASEAAGLEQDHPDEPSDLDRRQKGQAPRSPAGPAIRGRGRPPRRRARSAGRGAVGRGPDWTRATPNRLPSSIPSVAASLRARIDLGQCLPRALNGRIPG